MSPSKIHTLPSPAALESYGISENGFLPAHATLSHLPDDYYQPWEDLICNVSHLIESQQVRVLVDELPLLHTSRLDSEAEWQRAYSILAILAQAYIWQGPEPSQHLPPQITVPFLTAADHLEVQPVATYAALNLWNWRPVKDSACSGRGLDSKNFNICDPDELVALHTATGTDDESWFFVISNSMEAHAGPLIRTLLAAMEAVEVDDTETIISSLEYFCRTMVSIGRLLERMDERCNPQVFYHKIRPFLAGSMNMEAAGLPDGVFYDEGDGKGQWRKYRGGSNGQSSLFQFFDAVLSVDHNRSGGFHEEMRRYMPGPHARFLNDIESIANIRSYVNQHPEDIGLVEAFNRAVAGLSDVRDKHIALVTRYIIVPSRQKKPTAQLGMNGLYRRDLASTSSQLASQKPQTQELVGTGGTKLIPFLRTSRDETNETAIIK